MGQHDASAPGGGARTTHLCLLRLPVLEIRYIVMIIVSPFRALPLWTKVVVLLHGAILSSLCLTCTQEAARVVSMESDGVFSPLFFKGSAPLMDVL